MFFFSPSFRFFFSLFSFWMMHVMGRIVVSVDKIRLCSMKELNNDFHIQNEGFLFSLLCLDTFFIWWSCFGWERAFWFFAKIITKQKVNIFSIWFCRKILVFYELILWLIMFLNCAREMIIISCWLFFSPFNIFFSPGMACHRDFIRDIDNNCLPSKLPFWCIWLQNDN